MRRPLTSRERRGAALAALAALLWLLGYGLLYRGLLAPLAALDEETQALRERNQHQARLLAERPALVAALQQADHEAAQGNLLLAGEDPNAAAADLMQLVLDQVAGMAAFGPGCTVAQRTPIAPPQADAAPYRPVQVGLTLNCGMESLARLLQRLEYGQPALFVDALSLRREAGAPATGGPGRLQVQLLMRGYLQAATAQARP